MFVFQVYSFLSVFNLTVFLILSQTETTVAPKPLRIRSSFSRPAQPNYDSWSMKYTWHARGLWFWLENILVPHCWATVQEAKKKPQRISYLGKRHIKTTPVHFTLTVAHKSCSCHSRCRGSRYAFQTNKEFWHLSMVIVSLKKQNKTSIKSVCSVLLYFKSESNLSFLVVYFYVESNFKV